MVSRRVDLKFRVKKGHGIVWLLYVAVISKERLGQAMGRLNKKIAFNVFYILACVIQLASGHPPLLHDMQLVIKTRNHS